AACAAAVVRLRGASALSERLYPSRKHRLGFVAIVSEYGLRRLRACALRCAPRAASEEENRSCHAFEHGPPVHRGRSWNATTTRLVPWRPRMWKSLSNTAVSAIPTCPCWTTNGA